MTDADRTRHDPDTIQEPTTSVTPRPALRRFLLRSHTIDPSGAWGLDDLCGDGGRVDVAARFLNSVLFLSHGIRDDVEAYIVVGAGTQARTIRVTGSRARSFNPDERSLASRIRQALQAGTHDPWWNDVDAGLAVGGFGLQGLLKELDRLSPRPGLVLLDPDGAPLEEAALPSAPLFCLSDHEPFTDHEYRLLDRRNARRISLGDAWYHGNHVVSVVQYGLDRRQERGA